MSILVGVENHSIEQDYKSEGTLIIAQVIAIMQAVFCIHNDLKHKMLCFKSIYFRNTDRIIACRFG